MWALVTSKPEAASPTFCHVASAVSQVLEVTSESNVFQSQRMKIGVVRAVLSARNGVKIGVVKAVLSARRNRATWEMGF